MLTIKPQHFTLDFIRHVDDITTDITQKKAKVGGVTDEANQKDSDVRRSFVKFFYSPEIRNALFEVVNEVNAFDYGFDIYNMAQLQYTMYMAENKGHYDWHQDEQFIREGRTRRKLSVSVQLSHPNDYEGGDFEMQDTEVPEMAREMGSVLIFPSYEYHRVTPVTKGIRKSLVAWFEGPAWR